MAGNKDMRLSQLARKLNVGTNTIVEFLADKGFEVENKPNTKVTSDQVGLVNREFQDSAQDKEEAKELTIGSAQRNVVIDTDTGTTPVEEKPEEEISVKSVAPVTENKNSDKISAEAERLEGIKVVGKIDLNKKSAPKKEEKPAAKKEVKPEPEVAKKVAKPAKQEEKAPVTEKPKEKEPVAKKEAPAPVVKEEKKPEVTKEPAPKADKGDSKDKKETTKVEAKETAKPESKPKEAAKETPAVEEKKPETVIEAKADSLRGLKVLGKIELPTAKKKQPIASSDPSKKKRKRTRIESKVDPKKPGGNQGGQNRGPGGQNRGPGGGPNRGPGNRAQGGKRGRGANKPQDEKKEISSKEIQDKIKATMKKLSGGNQKAASRSKYRRDKRSAQADARDLQEMIDHEESKVLKVTEFISANDLASLMGVSVNDVISTCMTLGMFVSINQRLDAESITFIADEFGFKVEFTSTEEDETLDDKDEEENQEDLEERAPIVTIMGHVDHGKTSLLDYIRDAKIAAGEAGGITQHIGAYNVTTESGKPITFLDTPGHEAFTAMRARGAKITDIVILVVAADDRVMPQTIEAINHAQIAGVPIIVALNKCDKPTANPDKIKEELSKENILVEDWGGKYQVQEVSAKTGQGIDELLEKVLIESELLELTANAKRDAVGTVVEASLDKGRGYLSTCLIQKGTLSIGDIVVAGQYYGRVKAMMNHRGLPLKGAGPSSPAQVLGLNGAPQAGDKIVVVESDREAREITTKRSQILREQSVRTKKHLTLDEIGRRLAVGAFKELNLIIKGDVDGSVEALTDSLLKLSTDEVQVNVIHKAVGQITESDVNLAAASDAIIIGFQVRPSQQAKVIADNEEIEIRMYSVIYKAIDEMKDALEGLLEPTIEEVITGNVEIREVFKITKIGTVAGCYVRDGVIKRKNLIRIIRDGIVVYSGEIGALKRFKDDVAEVKNNYECGLSIKNFNDLKEGDVIEAYEEREVKRTL